MFHLQARDVPYMNSYAAAKEEWDERKPVREYPETRRHLSRNKGLQLGWNGEVYTALYDENPVVTYHKDGTITLNNCGWRTPSTATFIRECTGLHAYTHRGELYLSGAHRVDGTLVHGQFMVAHDTHVVAKTHEVLNPQQQQRRVLDKERAAGIRKELHEALQLARTLLPAMTYSDALFAEYARQWSSIIRDSGSGVATATAFEGRDNLHAYAMFSVLFLAKQGKGELPDILKQVETELRNVAYRFRHCYIDVDVPLGELPKPDRL